MSFVAEQRGRGIQRVEVAWTSTAGGAASAAQFLFGKLCRVTTIPNGVAAPTDNYDVTLVDEDGVDVAGGNLADRDTANTENVVFANKEVIGGLLTPTVANAGNAKQGTIVIWLE